MRTRFGWRSMAEADLAEVADIARITFPDHHEDPACFAERLAVAPRWCFALDGGTGELMGYLIAYPWPLGTIPPLNASPGSLPAQQEALFLHDLAIRPNAAGVGRAGAMVEELASRAQEAGIGDIALVAVNHTAGFWHRHRFVSVEGSPVSRHTLASYGQGALYLRRRLTRDRSTN